ncbi:MAG TPA: Lrp/AsnC family transcriptional regulator [Nanoarchaeota archaeon]|nr:Lrp/AsnC family transcriptional regulator [Nanoarchaeota archaeon]HIH63902.1 Lrp/AsnC family transcriptional regulator [Nanoarchaeota archaeon]HIJ09801.1 Lrp/AsnC family transcriptional regulator [Nanoarchaeota archaeon]
MDQIDTKILNVLLENSNRSYRKIASFVGVSGVTVLKRMKELEKEKVIKNHTINLDYEKLGYDVSAIINMRITHGMFKEAEKKLSKEPNVFAIYDITGDFDAMMIAKFKNRKSLNTFLKKIQEYDFIKKTETSLILNTIKEENIRIS